MEECTLVNVCRACLTQEGEFQSVFVPDENCGLAIHLAEMIMDYASVQITFGDGLPDQICIDCAEKAVKLYLFKKKCEQSDTLLRERLGKSPLHLDDNEVPQETSESKPVPADFIIKSEVDLKLEETQATEGNGNNKDFDGNCEECEELLERSDHESDYDQEQMYESDSKSKYPCNVCPKVFNQENFLNKHKKQHEFKEFECEACCKAFTRHDLFIRHKLTHIIKMERINSEETFNTLIYSDMLNESATNSLQAQNTEDIKLIPCNMMAEDKEDVFSEMHDVNPEKGTSLKCTVCQKKFTKSSHLTRHMKIHASVRMYACNLCNKSFARQEQLSNHMNLHSGIKPHVCKICSKGFNQISNLKDHIRTHNGEKPFLCSTCGKGFNQLGNLRQHTIRHSGIKAHLCSTCGNGFASKGELCAHVRKHTGARPFVCPTCNHGFTTSSSLTKHKRIHSGEKPYECEVCKMRFSRSGILARHKRTHTGEKPYVCKFCSKAFSQSNDLSSHLRIHTGEKPFICDSCGQAFRQSSALKTHKKTHVDRTGLFDKNRSVTVRVHSTFLNTIE